MAPDARSLFAEAVRHHQAGRLEEAAALYRQALACQPVAGAYHNLGNALFALGRLEEAEASYRQALKLQPNLTGAHNNLGTLFLEQDRLDEAAASYRKALSLQPDYAEALNNLGAVLCRQGELRAGEASIRHALSLKPDFAAAHDNLGTALWEQGRLAEAETSFRQALQLAPDFARALEKFGALLKDQGRFAEAIAVYRRFLQIRPDDSGGLNGLASALAAGGDAAAALEAIQRSLRREETAAAKRIFVDISKQLPWRSDNAELGHLMARALVEPWARPDELTQSAARLLKQEAEIGALVARAARAWPQVLTADALFGPGGIRPLASDELLLALLTSAQNSDVALERFLTMARRALLEAAAADVADQEGNAFYAALARQCFINEYVFSQSEEESRQAAALRDDLEAALAGGAAVSSTRLAAVAAYFPLHSLSGALRLLDRTWPKEIVALLAQQVREPQEEEELRATIPRITPIADRTSRLVQAQYEENPYPRWVRMPAIEKANSIRGYLRRKFPFAASQGSSGETIAFLSAGCGTGQLPLETAQGFKAHVLAVDLSLISLGYAKRKARELALTDIEFAQGDILELGAIGRTFDVIECSGVLHHLADPFAGWRTLLSLLKPGGFMLVGLYSEVARRGIVEARRCIAERGYGSSADDIRRCRQDLLDLDPERKLGTGFGDFFGVSGCRDLLFHVQERRIKLSSIAAFLEENDLTFLGFEMDNATLQAYRRRFPADPAAVNLAHWEAFENDNPDTFARMYVFWIQKAA